MGILATFARYISNNLLTPPNHEEEKPEADIHPFENTLCREWMK